MSIIEPGMKIRILVIGLLFISLFISARSDAGEENNPARPSDYVLVTINKNVYIQKDPADEKSRKSGDLVAPEDFIVSDGAGEANLTYKKDSTFKIYPNTEMQVVASGLRIKRGKTWVNFKKTSGGFSIATPTATIGIRGTKFMTEVAGDGETKVTLAEGSLLIENEKGKTELASGSAAVIKKGAAPEVLKVKNDDDAYIRLK